MKKVLKKAVDATPEFSKGGKRSEAGTIAALARHLGVSRGAICQWGEIPTKRVLEIERVTGVSRAELRPDLFGAEAGA